MGFFFGSLRYSPLVACVLGTANVVLLAGSGGIGAMKKSRRGEMLEDGYME